MATACVCWLATMASTAPQLRHALLVPHPPGASASFEHASASPGRVPMT